LRSKHDLVAEPVEAPNETLGRAMLVDAVEVIAVSCSNRHQKYICGREHVVYYPDLYYFWRRW